MNGFPSVQHISSTPKTPQFNTPLSSTPKTSQFNTKTPSVPHQKPLSSTHPLVKTVKLAYIVEELFFVWEVCWTEGFLVRNWRECWTKRFLVWNWGVFGVELRNFGGWKKWPFCVELMCWTERDPLKFYFLFVMLDDFFQTQRAQRLWITDSESELAVNWLFDILKLFHYVFQTLISMNFPVNF